MPTAEAEAWELATTEATGADGAVDEERRFAVFKAGFQSAEDPEATIAPQRARTRPS